MGMKEARSHTLVLGKAPSFAIRNEAARHPFRRTLPRKLFIPVEKPASEQTESQPRKWMNEDVSLFLLSFTAFFTAFSAFII